MSDAKRKRSIYLRVDEVRLLDHWCHLLRMSFGEMPYLVGSVLERTDHRDVDIRIILTDEKYDAIPMNVRDLNMLLSRWGQQMTGLPIDCQVQSAAESKGFDGPINPRGYGA